MLFQINLKLIEKTNFKENDLINAHKYADLSLKADKYNPAGKYSNMF